MTTAQRQVEALMCFKVVNEKQRRQSSADMKKYIIDKVMQYNTMIRFPDEPIMTVSEMRSQLERKIDIT